MKMICSLLCNIILIFVVSMFSGCGSSSQGGYDSAVGWAVGGSVDGYGMILHTRDGGKNWENISWQIGGIAHANGICAFDAKTIWVAADYNVMHFTSTGGEGETPWKNMNLASWDNADFWLMRVTRIHA